MKSLPLTTIASWLLRLSLATAFLSAVADRFGLWGSNGAPHVAWGDWSHFAAYSQKLTWFVPDFLAAPAAYMATALEIILPIWLLIGIRLRLAALASAGLLFVFAISMVVGLGIKAPLDYSVFTAAAGALGLAALSGNRQSAESSKNGDI